MDNIIDFRIGQPRPRRSAAPPSDGAQILFFTGVRYEREVEIDPPSFVPEAMPFPGACDTEMATAHLTRSEVPLDLAAH